MKYKIKTRKTQSEILGIVFVIVLVLIIFVMFIFFNFTQSKEKLSNYKILIANKFYSSILNENLYTGCKSDLSLIRLVENYYDGLVTTCDNGTLVRDFLTSYFNNSLQTFLANNGINYFFNLSDGYSSFIFINKKCARSFYTLPTQTIITPRTSRRITVTLRIC